jgi:hypothetical protein
MAMAGKALPQLDYWPKILFDNYWPLAGVIALTK